MRKDEEQERLKVEAEEQRLQEEDAAARLRILRGEIAVPLPSVSSNPKDTVSEFTVKSESKKRRREDDIAIVDRHLKGIPQANLTGEKHINFWEDQEKVCLWSSSIVQGLIQVDICKKGGP